MGYNVKNRVQNNKMATEADLRMSRTTHTPMPYEITPIILVQGKDNEVNSKIHFNVTSVISSLAFVDLSMVRVARRQRLMLLGLE